MYFCFADVEKAVDVHVCRVVHRLGGRLAYRCSAAVHVKSSALRGRSAVPYAMMHDDGECLCVCAIMELLLVFDWSDVAYKDALCGSLGEPFEFLLLLCANQGCTSICRSFCAVSLMRHLVEASGSTVVESDSSVKYCCTVCPVRVWPCV